MAKRGHGHGSITPMPDGRFWVRSARQADGTRPSLGYVATQQEADLLLAGAAYALSTRTRGGVQTFEAFGRSVLDERELNDIRGVDKERLRFELHLATAHFAGQPIDSITPVDIAEWLRAMQRKKAKDRRGARPLSRLTIQRVLSLVSAIFEEAGPQGRGLLGQNPCLGMRVKSQTKSTEEVWTFLSPEEQKAIRTSKDIAAADRLAILFALGTGLRQGEQFNLELRDLHCAADEVEPRVVVRFGSRGKAPKNGKIRTVPLFGLALDAAREWLKVRGKVVSPLVFPTPTGSRRRVGKPLGNGRFIDDVYTDRFVTVLALAGIRRSVRWHDLRHSCASSLVGGFWGEPWSLEEVKEMLGHSSVTVTQRYAHLGETAMKRAVRKIGGGLVDGGGQSPSSMCGIRNDSVQSRESGLNRRPVLYESTALPLSYRGR
jgi:integrase